MLCICILAYWPTWPADQPAHLLGTGQPIPPLLATVVIKCSVILWQSGLAVLNAYDIMEVDVLLTGRCGQNMLFGMVTKQQQDGGLHVRSSCAVV